MEKPGEDVYKRQVDTKDIMPLATGEIVSARISGVQRGESGTPGELKGLFTSEKALGTLRQNGETGVYGLFHQAPQGTTMPVAYKQEVKEGAAQILCTLEGDTPKLYNIDIDVYKRQPSPRPGISWSSRRPR